MVAMASMTPLTSLRVRLVAYLSTRVWIRSDFERGPLAIVFLGLEFEVHALRGGRPPEKAFGKVRTVAYIVWAVPRNLQPVGQCRRCAGCGSRDERSRYSCHVANKPAFRSSSSNRSAFRGAWPRTWLLKNNTPVLAVSTMRRSFSSIHIHISSSE